MEPGGAPPATPPAVRNHLVNNIASNIFDTLKSNEDIAAILGGVLDPARTDKQELMKHLMATINTTLQVRHKLYRTADCRATMQDSLLARAGSLTPAHPPDSLHSSTRCRCPRNNA